MSNVLLHRFSSAKADGADATKVQPSNWNDGHNFTGGANGNLLARDTSDAIYGSGWSTNLTYLSNVLAIAANGAFSVGATPASAGDFRARHAFAFNARDNGNANDRRVLGYGNTTTDTVELGNAVTNTDVYGAAIGLKSPATITGGTVTASTPVISATQTWNNSGVTFTGWKLNVTDSASAAASLLADWQVGGVSMASVSKGGALVVNQGITLNNGGGGYQLRFGDPTSASLMANVADGVLKFGTHDASAGVSLRFSTDQRLEVRDRGNSAYGDIFGRALAAFSTGANVAGAGDFRMAHGGSLQARDSTNAANRSVLAFGATTTDTVELGNATTNTDIYGASVRFVGTGPHAIGTTTVSSTQLTLGGSFANGIGLAVTSTLTPGAFAGRFIGITGTMNVNAGQNGYGAYWSPTFVEAASGNHALLATHYIAAAAVTAGVATVTNTASLYVDGPMAATVTGANYAIWSAAGVNRFDADIQANSDIRLGGTGTYYWGSRSKISSPADGKILFTDNGGTSFTMVQYGGTTVSYPALKRNGAVLESRLADDSGYANFTANIFSGVNFNASNGLTAPFAALGGTPATAGELRFNTGFSLQARNVGNTANGTILSTDAQDVSGLGAQLIAVANDANASIGSRIGIVIILNDTDGQAAIFQLRGATGNAKLNWDPESAFSVASGTASRSNVYWDSGSSVYRIENKTGSTKSYRVIVIGKA